MFKILLVMWRQISEIAFVQISGLKNTYRHHFPLKKKGINKEKERVQKGVTNEGMIMSC